MSIEPGDPRLANGPESNEYVEPKKVGLFNFRRLVKKTLLPAADDFSKRVSMFTAGDQELRRKFVGEMAPTLELLESLSGHDEFLSIPHWIEKRWFKEGEEEDIWEFLREEDLKRFQVVLGIKDKKELREEERENPLYILVVEVREGSALETRKSGISVNPEEIAIKSEEDDTKIIRVFARRLIRRTGKIISFDYTGLEVGQFLDMRTMGSRFVVNYCFPSLRNFSAEKRFLDVDAATLTGAHECLKSIS